MVSRDLGGNRAIAHVHQRVSRGGWRKASSTHCIRHSLIAFGPHRSSRAMLAAWLVLLGSVVAVNFAMVPAANSGGMRAVGNGPTWQNSTASHMQSRAERSRALPVLEARIGPGTQISLTSGGRTLSRLAPGAYKVRVRDRSRRDNFHLSGPGVNRRTSIALTGQPTWTVRFVRGVYRFRSDAHPSLLRGTFDVG